MVQHQDLAQGQGQAQERLDHRPVLGVQFGVALSAGAEPGHEPPLASGPPQQVNGEPEGGHADPCLRLVVAGELAPAAGRANEGFLGGVLGAGQVPG